jgi:Uma2 family endonuclease
MTIAASSDTGKQLMATTAQLYTADDLARMPTDEPWELWDGELRKVPGAGFEASDLAQWIGVLISNFARPRRLGKVTGADGTYVILCDPQTVVVPDVAFVKAERLPERERRDGYFPLPPDLAVEVISPTDEPGDIAKKQDLYRRAGVPLVWWVHPTRRTVAVYRDGQFVAELIEGDELDGEPVLPGFRLPVEQIFAEL